MCLWQEFGLRSFCTYHTLLELCDAEPLPLPCHYYHHHLETTGGHTHIFQGLSAWFFYQVIEN